MVLQSLINLGFSVAKAIGNIIYFFLGVTGLRLPLWNLFTHCLTHHRTWIVMLFVLPLSVCFDVFWRVRTWWITVVNAAPHLHAKRVERIQNDVKRWAAEGKKTRMCTARPGWLTVSPRHASYKKTLYTVKTHDLHDILHLDTEKRILTVEPAVNILQILDWLIPRGYTLPVVPELDELTVGGLINGYGIESSSHVHGLFCDLAVAYEIVVPSGEVLRVTPKDKLFHCIPWSYGTLGFLTAVELKVIPAAKYVRHKYIPVYSIKQACKVWTDFQTSEDAPDFIEGHMYTATTGVMFAGYYTNEVKPNGPKVNNINVWYKPYFYKHAEDALLEKREFEELIPLKEYYRRHNRSIFWALEDQVPVCNNPFFRFFFGWALPPRVALLKLIESPTVTAWYEEKYVLQDFMVPLEYMEDLIHACNKHLRVYPLWFCPYRIPNNGDMQGKVRAPKGSKPGGFGQYIDIAAVGEPENSADFDCAKAIRLMEEFLRDKQGIQGNYSYTYQTPQEFRQMFDHTMYDEVRKELDAEKAFPEGYEKLARKNQWSIKNLPPLITN